MPRSTEYTEEVGKEICARLMEGQTMVEICKDEEMPAKSTVYKWIQDIESFSDKYAQARIVQAHTLFDETMIISDDGSNDYMDRNDPENKGYDVRGEHIQRSRLRVDTRKFYIAKVLPKIYGDKITKEITGPEGGPIQTLTTEMTQDQAAQIYKDLLDAD